MLLMLTSGTRALGRMPDVLSMDFPESNANFRRMRVPSVPKSVHHPRHVFDS
jgi:hypothetical protein